MLAQILFEYDPDVSVITDLAVFYQNQLPGNQEDLVAEWKRWKIFWNNVKQSNSQNVCDVPPVPIPKSIPETYRFLGKNRTNPSLSILVHILFCLPATTCTSERSFSALKYLKGYLRATMKEKRLNGIAALYIHKDIELNVDRVIDEFGRKNRRLKFTEKLCLIEILRWLNVPSN